MYQIRLYENTGFNSVNIPYSKAYLSVAANQYYDSVKGNLPPLDIIQNRNLASIRINATWDMVNQADYVVLYKHNKEKQGTSDAAINTSIRNNGWCYIITNAVMANTDTAILTLSPDFLTSVNAAEELSDEDGQGDLPLRIIDGIVSRSSWALNQLRTSGGLNVLDVDLNDTLLTPSGSMKILTDRLSAETLGSGSGRTILLSTIDLSSAHNTKALKFTVPNTVDSVVVPTIDYVDNASSVEFSVNNPGSGSASPSQKYPGVCAVSFSGVTANSNIRKALTNIRALGLESAIIAQYYIPSIYCSSLGSGLVSSIQGQAGLLDSAFVTNDVKVKTHNGTISKILNYSPYESVGLVTATGSKMEAHPQDLRNSSGDALEGLIPVAFIADPRPEGRPYFTIAYLHGQTLGITSLLLNSVEGLPWQSVPLVWNQGASGNALNTARYNTSFTLGQNLTKFQMGNAGKLYDLYNQPISSRILNEISDATTTTTTQHTSAQSMMSIPGVRDFYANRDKQIEANIFNSANYYEAAGTSKENTQMYMNQINAARNSASVSADASRANFDIAGKGAELINSIAHSPGLNALFGYDIKAQTYANTQSETLANFVHDSLIDRLEYDISNEYYAPSISFPYGAQIWDFLGNGVVRYKYKYNGNNEIHRLTTILKAYGVQYKEQLSKKYFGSEAEVWSHDANGSDSVKFIYVQTSSATVSGRARWINEGIAAQLNNGVRFWKGKPRHIIPTSEEEVGS